MDLIISCIHMGHPFFRSEEKIVSLLNSGFDRIFLLGDIWDTWEKSFPAILQEYEIVTKALEACSWEREIIFTRGNHDPSIEEIKEAFPRFTVCASCSRRDSSGPFVALHGDEFETPPLNIDWVSILLYHLFVKTTNTIFRYNLRDAIKDWHHNWLCKRKKKPYNSIVLDVEKKAIETYNRVIMGHTHIPKIVKYNGILYVNPGDWIRHRSYATYDFATNEYIVHGERL